MTKHIGIEKRCRVVVLRPRSRPCPSRSNKCCPKLTTPIVAHMVVPIARIRSNPPRPTPGAWIEIAWISLSVSPRPDSSQFPLPAPPRPCLRLRRMRCSRPWSLPWAKVRSRATREDLCSRHWSFLASLGLPRAARRRRCGCRRECVPRLLLLILPQPLQKQWYGCVVAVAVAA